MSLPRVLARSSARLGTVVLAALTALAASIGVAAVASAHVSVSTATLTTSDLATPLKSHGQEISTYVSVVEFRATEGGIAPGEFQEFALSGGPFPEADVLSFPTVQLYSDGSESAWIEPTVAGAEEPERPAPVLSLAAEEAAAPAAAQPTSDDHTDAAVSDSPAGLALFFSILALLVAIGGAVLGRRATRRTVSA